MQSARGYVTDLVTTHRLNTNIWSDRPLKTGGKVSLSLILCHRKRKRMAIMGCPWRDVGPPSSRKKCKCINSPTAVLHFCKVAIFNVSRPMLFMHAFENGTAKDRTRVFVFNWSTFFFDKFYKIVLMEKIAIFLTLSLQSCNNNEKRYVKLNNSYKQNSDDIFLILDMAV